MESESDLRDEDDEHSSTIFLKPMIAPDTTVG